MFPLPRSLIVISFWPLVWPAWFFPRVTGDFRSWALRLLFSAGLLLLKEFFAMMLSTLRILRRAGSFQEFGPNTHPLIVVRRYLRQDGLNFDVDGGAQF